MKIAIVGAGFAGLSAAYKLLKNGFDDVTIYEMEEKSGGLAGGFKEPSWDWNLENYYHHFFPSDDQLISLARKIGQKFDYYRPLTSTYVNNNIYQLDSPLSLLKFSEINFLSRIRTGISLFHLKYIATWEALEKFTAEKFIKFFEGEQSWYTIWEPLFKAKFGKSSSEISAAWFWSRIKKRSKKLGYPEGGFQHFLKLIENEVQKNGGIINYSVKVDGIKRSKIGLDLKVGSQKYTFDKIIVTLPTNVFAEIVAGLSTDYKNRLLDFDGIGVVNIVLSLKRGFLEDNLYWLNINDTTFPFLALVEHTNFIDKKNYNGEHLVYVGNYLRHNHKQFGYLKGQLLKEYLPYLKKINPKFSREWINNVYLFKNKFAQPIISVNYSKKVLKIETPIEGLYLANMQQVYPWDRGINYAIEIGYKAADIIIEEA